jgi:hypothetical protein
VVGVLRADANKFRKFLSTPCGCYALILALIGKVNAMASRYPSLGLSTTLILLASTCTAFADSTCYCRTSTGERVAVGDIACLKTNDGMQEARCGFVLNTTAWKLTGNPCPLAWNGSKQGRKSELATILGR